MNFTRYFFIVVVLLLCSHTFSQSSLNYFHLSDSVFKVGDRLTTKSIIFELNKPTLKKSSLIYLDSLVNFLKKFKNLVIEIQNYGREEKNEYAISLPQKRAKTIKDYLIKMGIFAERLRIVGFHCDKQKPQVSTKKKEQLKSNTSLCDLRTEFLILSKESVIK